MHRPLTEERNALAAQIDRLSTLEMLRVMNREDAMVAGAVGKELPRVAAAVDANVDRMRRGGRLI
jgi:N-acetylmuramic acid 6-phosphate etherase